MEGLNCSSCIPKRDTAEAIERAERERKRKGCTEPTNNPQFQDDETGEIYYRCPLSQVKDWVWGVLNLYNCFEAGFLPVNEGVLFQPAKIMNFFKMISKYKFEYMKKKNKEK